VLSLSGICVPPTVNYLQYLATVYGRRAFSVAGPTVWNSVPDFIRDPTISAECFRRLFTRIYSLDTNAFSALEVLDLTALYTSAYLLTYLLAYLPSIF